MNAIELIANQRTILRKELDEFILKYNGEQYHLIGALANKIEHMCNHIGCPSSVLPMLTSISKGKIKYWADGYNNRGQQLNSRIHRDELERKHCNLTFEQIEGTDGSCESHYRRIVKREEFVKGHFRWNFSGYIADYYTRDYIKAFFIDNNVDEFLKGNKTKGNNLRIKPIRTMAAKDSDNHYYVTITTPRGNDYRIFYRVDLNKWICNFADGKPTSDEINLARRYINAKFDKNF